MAVSALICPAFSGHPHRALLSGLAAGVPVVSTPSTFLAAAFGVNELTFIPAGNPLALANAITDLLGNPIARERRAVAAARIVRDQFSAIRQLPRWRTLMEGAFGV
jgi:glycosyltransferase involved in cell wall biosynthesis